MLEWAACALGLVGVFLMAREVRVGFLVGMAASLVSVALYYREAVYAQVFLNLGYFGLQVYGWAYWGAAARQLPVTRLGWRAWPWLLAALLPTFAIAHLTLGVGGRYPELDASVTVYSLLAQLWMARKKRECWLLFMAADFGAVVLNWLIGYQLVAGLYVIYMAIGAMGYATWRE